MYARVWPLRRALFTVCCLLLSLGYRAMAAEPAASAGPLEEWDQAERQLHQTVWRLYAATTAFGRDARGRTVEDDLNAWVMTSDVRNQLKTARSEAEHQLQTGDATGARATWSSAKEILDGQAQRLAVVGFYWTQQTALERQRALWQRWLKQSPEDVAAGSRSRIDKLAATLTTDFSPTMGYGALTKDITALEEAYDKERQQLARQVSERQFAAGEKIASRDRTVPCPQGPATADGHGEGDRAPRLLSSPSAEQYYPPEARSGLITGDVILRVTVGADGCMKHAEVASSSGAPQLDDAALDLIEWATFSPARVSGKLVESTSSVKYHFILDENVIRAGRAAPDGLTSKGDAQVASALQEAYRAASNGENDKARAIVDPMVASNDLDALTPQLKLGLWRLAAWLALDARDGARALEMSKHVTELDNADANDWRLRVSAAMVAKNHTDATASLITLARRWPTSLSGLAENIAGEVVRETPKAAGGRYELFKALYDAGYTSNGVPPSGWWRDLALLQLERGERAEAITTLSHIADPHVVIGILADKRFDSVKPDIRDHLDVAEMAQRAIDLRRDIVHHNPDKLESVVQLTYQLLYSEDDEETLKLCDQVIAQAADGSGPKTYTDWSRKYVWILDNRSRALSALGRWDEALVQKLAASKLTGTVDAVSQTINLAGFYNELSRPKEARDALARLDSAKLSGYGHMQVAIELLRSAVQLGDSAEVERQLQYLREHKRDSMSTLDFALISADRDDEAAQVLIARLEDPDERAAALMDVQDYHLGAWPAQELEFWKRWHAVIARPDVQAEIGKVGNVGSYPLRRRAS